MPAISAAAPAELEIACSSLLKSSSLAFTIASSPLIAFCPARFAAVAAFSLSVIPLKPFRSSCMTVRSDLLLPFSSVMETPTFFMASATALLSSAVSPSCLLIRASIPRSAVPALDASMALLPITPSATETSSRLYPRESANGPAYFRDSPSPVMSVLEFVAVAASMSATRLASSAFSPNCASADAVTSDAVARSTLPAAAKSSRPGIPAMMSPLFQPAIARFSIASAACAAENCVVSPSFFAVAVRSSKSFPVAPEMALTFAIPCSKSLNVLIVSATPREIPANAAACVIGLETSSQTFLKGADTRSTAFSVTVQTLPAIFFPAFAMPWIPLLAMSFSVAATSSLLFPFMPVICFWRFISDFSSLLTLSCALFDPLAVSSVTCATMSITVTCSFICVHLLSCQSSARVSLLPH